MTETTELDRAANADGTATAAAAPTSVRAVEGFFAPIPPVNSSETVSLFKRFQLEPPSWDEFQRKITQLEKPEADTTNVPRRVKVVYFVRHAEGIHNATANEFGAERWESELAFQEKYLDADHAIRLSPLSRAIQTAQNFFTKDQVPDGPFVCIEKLKRKFPAVDFSAIKDDNDLLWTPSHRETDEEMQARAKVFLLELFREIPEQHVAVVTHSGFMESVCAVVLGIRIHPANCEVIPLVLEAV
ncbi:hypothetical protein JG688_00004154 [Phytophthora aleatoria]|uniref:Phosphoglycerate mutase family n=1 Tax=Phytophthora aleatoria TaxID=2496075 RepID=A0A8J5IRH0_9STRA|nr:hypothetical protein JG688_00004154 [Phytophthora aleatoria]